MRLLLSLVVLAVLVLALLAMWWGWRNRARRHATLLPALPQPPADLGEPRLPPAEGVYVSTTFAGNWQDRVAVGDIGLRAAATMTLYPGGLLLRRVGADQVWLPAESLRAARVDRAMAGKVMGVAGLLVVRWRLGEHELDTGFRGEDRERYPEWITALNDVRGQGVQGGAGQ